MASISSDAAISAVLPVSCTQRRCVVTEVLVFFPVHAFRTAKAISGSGLERMVHINGGHMCQQVFCTENDKHESLIEGLGHS